MYERSNPHIKILKRPIYTKGNVCKCTEKYQRRNEFQQISWFELNIAIIVSEKLSVPAGTQSPEDLS